MRHAGLRSLVSDHLEGSLAHLDIEVLFIVFLIFFISHEIDLEIFIVVLNFTFVFLFIKLAVVVAVLVFRDGVRAARHVHIFSLTWHSVIIALILVHVLLFFVFFLLLFLILLRLTEGIALLLLLRLYFIFINQLSGRICYDFSQFVAVIVILIAFMV